jgi:DNA-binding SARP family transcriptional activator
MLHGLEALSRRLIEAGRAPEAVETAIVAVGFYPLRESAQRALISAHLAEGNLRETQRVFAANRQLLEREMGLRPRPVIAAMIPHAISSRSPDGWARASRQPRLGPQDWAAS